MKKCVIAGLVVTLMASAAVLRAQDPPPFPTPQKEHEWLQQFVGEWETDAEVNMEPGKPPVKCKGSETARPLGGFWVVGQGKSDMAGMPFTYMATMGYDTEKQKFVETWVDSMSSYCWHYEGKLDATGKMLTMEAEGPCPMMPGKLLKFKEVTEFKSKDHRVFTSSMQGEDGQWMTVVTVNSWRKK